MQTCGGTGECSCDVQSPFVALPSATYTGNCTGYPLDSWVVQGAFTPGLLRCPPRACAQ